jgi:large subunit ribosomal protein L35
MPKMKTKSSVKKRFKISATGKVIATQAGKQHNMRKRSKRQIRNQRGTAVLPEMEAKRIKQFMPYDL